MAAGWAAFLARFPPGARASFGYRPHPHEIVLDLAVQAAGLVSAPVDQGRQGQQGQQIVVGGESVVLPSWEEAERAGAAVPGPERLAGGGVVVRETVLSQGDLAAAADRLGREIPELPQGRRHILVLGGFAGDPAERSLLAWATVAGAAVLLEPEPAHIVPTAVWARPTVFAGTASDLARLREADERGRRRRLPFGRLQAVLETEGGLPAEEKAFWEERGVKCLAVPAVLEVLGWAGLFAAERQERGI